MLKRENHQFEWGNIEYHWKEKKREELVHSFKSFQRGIITNIFYILPNIKRREVQALIE